MIIGILQVLAIVAYFGIIGAIALVKYYFYLLDKNIYDQGFEK